MPEVVLAVRIQLVLSCGRSQVRACSGRGSLLKLNAGWRDYLSTGARTSFGETVCPDPAGNHDQI